MRLVRPEVSRTPSRFVSVCFLLCPPNMQHLHRLSLADRSRACEETACSPASLPGSARVRYGCGPHEQRRPSDCVRRDGGRVDGSLRRAAVQPSVLAMRARAHHNRAIRERHPARSPRAHVRVRQRKDAIRSRSRPPVWGPVYWRGRRGERGRCGGARYSARFQGASCATKRWSSVALAIAPRHSWWSGDMPPYCRRR